MEVLVLLPASMSTLSWTVFFCFCFFSGVGGGGVMFISQMLTKNTFIFVVYFYDVCCAALYSSWFYTETQGLFKCLLLSHSTNSFSFFILIMVKYWHYQLSIPKTLADCWRVQIKHRRNECCVFGQGHSKGPLSLFHSFHISLQYYQY